MIGSIQQIPPTLYSLTTTVRIYCLNQIEKPMTIAKNKSMTSFVDQGVIFLIFKPTAASFYLIYKVGISSI
jgi:hypothetical protein